MMNSQRLISIVCTVCLVSFVATSAMADDGRANSNALLKGKYRFSTSKTCTDASTGAIVHIHFFGTTTYDGDGHATLTERGTAFLPGPLQVSFEETADLTYEVKRNGSFSQEGTFTATDNSLTVTGAKMVGQIDAQGSVLILGAAIPAVRETLTFAGGGSLERLCAASGTAVRIRQE